MSRTTRYLVGTYTGETQSEGIYATELDSRTGRLTEVDLVAETDNPSWLTLADGHVVAANETDRGELTVFRESRSALSPVQRASSHGADPCHVAVAGDRLAVANYNGGTVALFEWRRDRIGASIVVHQHRGGGDHYRQEGCHPHGVHFLAGRLLVPDLGDDRIYVYRSGDGGLERAIDVPPGSGPRHLTADGSYLINELNNTIQSMSGFEPGPQASTLPADWEGKSIAAEIQRVGDLVYLSNRGHNSIATFDARSGAMSFVPCGGGHPRHFVIDPGGRWLLVANRDSHNIVSLPLSEDGQPGAPVAETRCPSPVQLMSWPDD